MGYEYWKAPRVLAPPQIKLTKRKGKPKLISFGHEEPPFILTQAEYKRAQRRWKKYLKSYEAKLGQPRQMAAISGLSRILME